MKFRGWILGVTLVSSMGLLACSNGTQFNLPASSDQFVMGVTYNNKVDIVLAVDNSTSMDAYQANLLAQMPDMISHLDKLKMDYHIAVISSSVPANINGGKFIGSPSFLQNNSLGLIGSLQDRIRLGSSGSDKEAPLQNFLNIFNSDYLQKEGQGFFRDDALLAIITLSDDDDHSSVTSSQFITKLNALKPNLANGQKNWIYNYLGVLNLQSPCRSILGTVTVGLKHVEIADASGGIKSNICDPTLANAVSNIRVRIQNILTDYPLSKVPKVDTIRVTMNGQSVPQDATNGWSYIPANNVIRFNGTYVRPSDAQVSADFDPLTAN